MPEEGKFAIKWSVTRRRHTCEGRVAVASAVYVRVFAKATLTDVRSHLPRWLGRISSEAPRGLTVARWCAHSSPVGADRDVTCVVLVDDGDGSDRGGRRCIVNDCEDLSLTAVGESMSNAERTNIIDVD